MSSPPPQPGLLMELRSKSAKRILETRHLILRAAQPSDSDALFPIFSDEQVMRYWSEPPHPSPKRTREWMDGMIKSSQNGVTDFIILLKNTMSATSTSSSSSTSASMSRSASELASSTSVSSDSTTTARGQHLTAEAEAKAEAEVIGKIGIYAAWPSNEIGFLLSRAVWGRGLAHEALSCMLDYLFHLPAYDIATGIEAGDKEVDQETNEINNNNNNNNNNDVDGKNNNNKDQENDVSEADRERELERERERDRKAKRLTTLSEHERRNKCWRYTSITTDVDPRNAACLKVLRKVGFAESGFVERTYCVGGTEWVDSVFLRLGREEWVSGWYKK